MATLNDFLEWGRYWPAPIREDWGLFLDTILFGAGTGIDAPYKFSIDTGVTDPTAGYAKINTGTVASATVMCISITDRNGDSRGLTLESITKDDVIGLISEADGDEYIFKVTGDQVNHTTWYEIPVEYLSSSGALVNDEDIIFSLVPIPITDHGDLEGLLDNDHPQYLLRDEWLQNGFPDSSEVDMSWDDASRTLTIQPVGASFRYYYEGILYTETGSLTETIPDTEGLWVIYIDGEGSMTTLLNPSHEQVDDVILNECIVAYIYWDAVNKDGRLLYELHGSVMSPATHHYLHDIMGAQYDSGMSVGDILVDQTGLLAADAQFSISAGEIYDEDIGLNIIASGQTDTKEVYWTDGSGNTRWINAEPTYPVASIGGVIAYNNGGTLTALTNNRYCLYHVFAINVKTDSNGNYPIVVIPGNTEYLLKSDARDGAYEEINTLVSGSWPVQETVPIATIIYQTKSTMTNAVTAATVSTDTGDDFIDWRTSSPIGSGGSTNDHGLLAGLSDDDHLQYLLASDATDRATFVTNWTDLTDGGVTALHSHAGGVTTFLGLTDTPSDYTDQSGKVASVNVAEDALEFVTFPAGVTTFTGLSDTPANYTDDASKIVGVKADETGLDYDGNRVVSEGVLFIDKASSPSIYLREGADAADYTILKDAGSTATFSKIAASGSAFIRISPVPSDNAGNSNFQFFRDTNTAGSRYLYIHIGDGTSVVQHLFNAGTGDVALCQNGVGNATRPTYAGTELALMSDLTGSSAAPATTAVTIVTENTTLAWVTKLDVTGIFQLEMIKFKNRGYATQTAFARVYIDGTLIFDSPSVSVPNDSVWYSILGPGAAEYIASMFSSTSLKVDIYATTTTASCECKIIYQELEY